MRESLLTFVSSGRSRGGRWIALLVLAGLILPAGRMDASSPALPDDGIQWQEERKFWSFQPPVAPEPRVVRNADWPRQPLDYFILARLETHKLQPSAEADRRTLLRRLSFDLTGLPPAPEDVKAFVEDERGDAYERVVERLLASPQFGERMASLWLPLARYAEDQAHQVGSDTKYFYPNAYKYREWVIDAFNRDLSYADFIRFQLAADQFESAEDRDLAALGFLGLGPKYYGRKRLEVMADEWEDRVDTVTRTMLGLTVACARCHDHKFEPITMRDYYALAGVFASTKMVNKRPDGEIDEADKAEKMSPATLHMVEDGELRDLNVFLRGNTENKGPVVERRFLRLLDLPGADQFEEGSGRRELAEAIANPDNPLTARVMVNRVWGWLTGRPLAVTPSNLGHSGEPPSHPDLLDYLAVRFMEENWSVKQIVREIVLSATYRQTSSEDPVLARRDPGNALFGRMNRRRLSAEQWRDSALWAAGNLERAGGKSMELDDPQNHRRTVYARVSRLELNDFLMQFDYPDANVHAEDRAVTTTPTQKLFFLNNPFVIDQAKALAARVAAEVGPTNPERVRTVYRLLLSREPDATELALALEFLELPDSPEMSRWEQYAQVLLASNEMLYVD